MIRGCSQSPQPPIRARPPSELPGCHGNDSLWRCCRRCCRSCWQVPISHTVLCKKSPRSCSGPVGPIRRCRWRGCALWVDATQRDLSHLHGDAQPSLHLINADTQAACIRYRLAAWKHHWRMEGCVFVKKLFLEFLHPLDSSSFGVSCVCYGHKHNCHSAMVSRKNEIPR